MPDNLILDIADTLAPDFRVAFLDAINGAKEFVPLHNIEQAIRTGNRTFLAELVATLVQQHLIPAAQPILAVFEQAIKAGAIAGGIRLGTAFELTSPRVASWIMSHAGRWVLDLADTRGLRKIIQSGHLDGIPVRAQARIIRGAIGLLERDTDAVDRYTDGLKNQHLPAERIADLSELYEHRLLSRRAETIARTESIRSTLAGQYEIWRQMFDDGILEIDYSWLEWDVTEDDRLCPYCAPLDGKRVRFGQDFVADKKGFPEGLEPETVPPRRRVKPDPRAQPRDLIGRFKKAGLTRIKPITWPDGTLPHPPLHPNCRCDVRLIIE